MQNKKLKKLVALTVALMMVMTSCGLIPEKEEELAPPIKAPDEVEYQTQIVARGEISNTVKGAVTAISKTQYNLSFTQRGGYLKSLEVKLGQYVEKGTVIATLDTASLEKDYKVKQIQIDKLNMEIDKIISDAKTNLQRAQADLNTLNERIVQLAAMQQDTSLTPEQLKAVNDEIAIVNPQIHEKNVEVAELNKAADASQNFDVLYKKKDLEILALELGDLQDTLDKSTIVAPQSGNIVFIEEVAVGDYVAALKTIVKLADPQDLIFEYKGINASKITLGMEGVITIKGQDYNAQVTTTPSNVPTEQYEIYKDSILFTVEQMPEGVELGNSGDFQIVIEQKQDVIVIPKRSVVQYVGSYYARVLEDGIRVEKSIEIGITTSTEYEILSGLQEGDVLILE